MHRIGVTFGITSKTWAEIFTKDSLYQFVHMAIIYALMAHTDFCIEEGLPVSDDLQIDEEMVLCITNAMINSYHNTRRLDDERNAHLKHNYILEVTTGTDPILLFNTTFIILGEVLFHNRIFQNEQNQQVFSNSVPLSNYLTLRWYCLLIEKENIRLNILNTIRFFICLDCALQLLVGRHDEVITQTLNSMNMDKADINVYIKMGSELFNQLKQVLTSSKAKFIDLEKQPDWDKVLN